MARAPRRAGASPELTAARNDRPSITFARSSPAMPSRTPRQAPTGNQRGVETLLDQALDGFDPRAGADRDAAVYDSAKVPLQHIVGQAIGGNAMAHMPPAFARSSYTVTSCPSSARK